VVVTLIVLMMVAGAVTVMVAGIGASEPGSPV